MIQGIGIDLQEISRIAQLVERYRKEIVGSLFTEQEWEESWRTSSPNTWLTVIFSFKEAVSKSFGTGMAGLSWTDIEVLPRERDAVIHLHGEAKTVASQKGIDHLLTSWSRLDQVVMTQVIAQSI